MRSDLAILSLIEANRLRVDTENGFAYAPKSNTPSKPIGAITQKGYIRACINVGGRQMHFMVHRIIWVSANGPLPPGHQIDHRDTNKQNNRLSNLEAVTGKENVKRAKMAGRYRGNGRKDDSRDHKGRFGKKAAGRLLDGTEHNAMPVQP